MKLPVSGLWIHCQQVLGSSSWIASFSFSALPDWRWPAKPRTILALSDAPDPIDADPPGTLQARHAIQRDMRKR
jgi:hypothetical protein